MYMMVKHIHLTAVALSILFFIVRFFWSLRQSPMMEKKWVKITPHIVDTVLLASAIGLCFILSQYPFVNPWLTDKVIGVVLYIVVGLYALKLARTTMTKWVGFAGALAWIAFIGKVAVTKQPLLFG
ncbi:SirB2 family protein [Aestuariibacter sp. AA17]|uniref:SirB2 family protein n=1 Tax=Fluctibacter corallii TaxID=2984329 RepID=A0ABT3ADA7_9ALTE|nr:SirB2 family protein [Aestuariibacter sp. AA17]MCV2886662.1 SirB2 family protein [Aestuariibacter sp. AA17]